MVNHNTVNHYVACLTGLGRNSYLTFCHVMANHHSFHIMVNHHNRGCSGGAMVLDKLPVLGRPTIRIAVGQEPTVLAVGAGESCLAILTLIYPFSPLSSSLWETARFRLKYCLKEPLNPKQPTNQPTITIEVMVRHHALSVMDDHNILNKQPPTFSI